MNFLGLTDVENEYTAARVAVLPVPYDETSTYRKGADQGPRALLYASNQLEHYDEELDSSPSSVGVATLPPPQPLPSDPEKMIAAVRECARQPVRDGKKLLSIGGEHSVTLPLVQAVHEAHPDLHLLQIDAHADLRDRYIGSPFNHACVMRRIHELGIPITQVGLRAVCRHEREFQRESGLEPIWAREIDAGGEWIDRVLARLGDPVYVSFDLDGLDPSIIPSTGTPVPGGLGWYQALTLLRRVAASRTVVAADVTELKPDPVNHHSEYLAATLVYKMIGYFWHRGS